MEQRPLHFLPDSRQGMRHALVGDGQSPHLLKWARALAPLADVWVCSSRGFAPELAQLVPAQKRLALDANPAHGGGNLALLRHLPAVARWLRQVDADWINPHYLTSHGTLVLLAKKIFRLRGQVLASAWGSDILVTPQRHAAYRWLTQAILRQAALCTSDSQHMAAVMQQLGARRVLTFPFGLDALPAAPQQPKQAWLFYANRGLEPVYRPLRVLECFAAIAAWQPQAQLVVANSGSQLAAMQAWVQRAGLDARVRFVGCLSADEQMQWYERAQWFISLPQSDSVAVSALEAMAHGCIPLLSDLPANRELVQPGINGAIVPDAVQGQPLQDWMAATLPALLAQADAIAAANRQWVRQHGLFAPAVQQLVQTMQSL